MRYSIVIPIYRNEESIEILLDNVALLANKLGALEVVFVVDGSPDRCLEKLEQQLPSAGFASQLVVLSRNFGAFPAVTAGMSVARGEFIAVMSGDLQEPSGLSLRFFAAIEDGSCDVVLGRRIKRNDPWATQITSACFWFLYRWAIQRDMPPGGIDVFACTQRVRDALTALPESNTSLVGLLIWLGFRRCYVDYERLPRPFGRSSWSFRRKVRYLKDSMFGFSDLPIRILGWIGIIGLAAAFIMTTIVIVGKMIGGITLPGYSATSTMILFFGGLNSLGLSLIGEYIWRNFENSKQRPRFVVFRHDHFSAANEATVK